MVHYRPTEAHAYCIDRTEVTQSEYQAFLDKGPPSDPDPRCADNTSLVPGVDSSPGGVQACSSFSPTTQGASPVGCVDFCDARAYCSAVGKRLCGGPGGARLSASAVTPTEDEWLFACTDGDASKAYPTSCAGAPPRAPECQNGEGVLDLGSSLSEWVESTCGAFDQDCVVHGADPAALTCVGKNRHWFLQDEHVGFRCCIDAD